MNRLKAILLGVGLAIGFAMPAVAQSNVTIFDFPGSPSGASTLIYKINDSGTVVGTEFSTGGAQGFVRHADGLLMTVKVPGAVFTQAGGINNREQVVGRAGFVTITPSGGFQHNSAFVMDKKGNTTVFDVQDADSTQAFAINDHGVIVGRYSANYHRHGFIRTAKGKITSYDAPDSLATDLWDVNNRGQIVGSYVDQDFNTKSFLLEPSGAMTLIEAPGAYTTSVRGINDHGAITGFADGIGFVRSARGIFRSLDIGLYGTTCWGINNEGTVSGFVFDDLGTHGLIVQQD